MDIKLVEKLIKALQYEDLTYSKLLSLGEKKTEYLVKNDTNALSEITEEENQLIDQTKQLNKVREQLVAMVCQGKTSGEGNTLENVKKLVPKEQADSMSTIQVKLRETVMKLVVRNNINQKLIENALKYINFNLELITSPAPATPIYGRSGEEVSGHGKRSMLDIKY